MEGDPEAPAAEGAAKADGGTPEPAAEGAAAPAEGEAAGAKAPREVLAQIEDDGTVDLAVMASKHPELKRFSQILLRHMRTTNKLARTVKSWKEANDFPDAHLLDTYNTTHITLQAVQKEVERLDCMDLGELDPAWGDKQTVRMSRKSLISVANEVMNRLDEVLVCLKEPVAVFKQAREAKVIRRASSDDELSLAEKYKGILKAGGGQGRPEESPRPAPAAGLAAAAPGDGAKPPAKRPRMAAGPSKADVEEALKRLQAKIGQPPQQSRPLKSYARQLMNFAGIPNLAKEPSLCRDSIECAVACVRAALDAGPATKVLRALMTALTLIEGLKDPSGLPEVLADLATAVQGMSQ